MQILLLGDVHCGARKDSLAFREYFTMFYTNILFPYIKKNKITTIIQLGDFFDSRKNTNISTLRWAKETIIEPLADLNCKMYIICGNHDIYYKNTISINSITEHLSHYNHIYPITKPTNICFDNTNIDLLPWIAPENSDEIFKFIEHSKSKICCGHLEFSGYNMNKDMLSTAGHTSTKFKKYEQVYSGHYHTASTDGHISYLGTPYELTWSDANDEKGFWVLDTVTEKLTRVINPYKMYHKIIYNDIDNKIDIPKFDFVTYKDSYIRVIIEKRNNVSHFEAFIEALFNNSTPHDISISDVTLAYRDVDFTTIEVEDPLTALITTLDNDLAINLKHINIDFTKSLIHDIYTNALNLGQEH